MRIEATVLTKTMKWASIAALLAAILWRPSAGYELLVQFAVCVGAILVIGQSYRVDKFRLGNRLHCGGRAL